MRSLVLATSNPGKLKEFQAYLVGDDWNLVLKPEALDIEETGTTFMENACLKASQVAKVMRQWAIADDSGLMVDALGGAPGLYSARFGRTDQERVEKLLAALRGEPNRRGQFVCAIAVADPDGAIVLQTEGVCPGEIAQEPFGAGGFGYDPIFLVPAQGMTFAEMPAEVKHRISHRGIAFEQLLPQLEQLGF
jgi:XTP/dITP diphosphohydrolase